MIELFDMNQLVLPEDIKNKISLGCKLLTREINKRYYNILSEYFNTFIIGSYGRGTAINAKNIDILVELPIEFFNDINKNMDDLTSSIRNALEDNFSNCLFKNNGHYITVTLDNDIEFIILPAYKNEHKEYVYKCAKCNTDFKIKDPFVGLYYLNNIDIDKWDIFNYVSKYLKYINSKYVSNNIIPGYIIDTFAFEAIKNIPNEYILDMEIKEKVSEKKEREENIIKYLKEYYQNEFSKLGTVNIPESNIEIKDIPVNLADVINYMDY